MLRHHRHRSAFLQSKSLWELIKCILCFEVTNKRKGKINTSVYKIYKAMDQWIRVKENPFLIPLSTNQ